LRLRPARAVSIPHRYIRESNRICPQLRAFPAFLGYSTIPEFRFQLPENPGKTCRPPFSRGRKVTGSVIGFRHRLDFRPLFGQKAPISPPQNLLEKSINFQNYRGKYQKGTLFFALLIIKLRNQANRDFISS
jgi:hypothetical protein